MLHSVDLEKDLVEMPLVARLRSLPSELVGVRLAELVAPAPDRLVAELHSPECHHQLDIPKAHTEVEIEPYALRDDLSRKPITTIRVGWHSISISSLGVTVPFTLMKHQIGANILRLPA